MNVTYEHIAYQGWENCHRLSNGLVDLVVSGGFGPRILRFGFVDSDNVFLEHYEDARRLPDDVFKLVGGHRLWHAPEHPQRTYVPDNSPLNVTYADSVLSMVQDAEPIAQIEKSIDVTLDSTSARAIVTHTLTNRGVWPVETGAWALSVMAIGGTAVLPIPPRAPHGHGNLLPASTFILWPYTDFSDPRWSFASRALMLHGNPARPDAQKVGAPVPDGWLAYWRDGTTFVKQFDFEPSAAYLDGGSAAELFTNGLFLELETLTPKTMLAPGESVEHVETWHLTRDLPAPTAASTEAYFAWITQHD